MPGDRVRAVQNRRRSNAAGPHSSRRTRAAEFGDALADWADDITSNEQPSHDTSGSESDEHDDPSDPDIPATPPS